MQQPYPRESLLSISLWFLQKHKHSYWQWNVHTGVVFTLSLSQQSLAFSVYCNTRGCLLISASRFARSSEFPAFHFLKKQISRLFQGRKTSVWIQISFPHDFSPMAQTMWMWSIKKVEWYHPQPFFHPKATFPGSLASQLRSGGSCSTGWGALHLAGWLAGRWGEGKAAAQHPPLPHPFLPSSSWLVGGKGSSGASFKTSIFMEDPFLLPETGGFPCLSSHGCLNPGPVAGSYSLFKSPWFWHPLWPDSPTFCCCCCELVSVWAKRLPLQGGKIPGS